MVSASDASDIQNDTERTVLPLIDEPAALEVLGST